MKWAVIAMVVGLIAAVWMLSMRQGTAGVTRPPSKTHQEAVIGTLVDSPLVQEIASPYPKLFRMAVVRGDQASEAIPKLDALERQQGWIAIFLGSEEDKPDFSAFLDPPEEPADIMKQSEGINAEKFLLDRALKAAGNNLDKPELLGDRLDEKSSASALPERYAVFRDVLTNKYHDLVYIALVPTDAAWKAPAYLQNGSWNDVPSAAEQVAVLRYWNEKYGARLRTFSQDVMELEVAMPPNDPDKSLALAKQQFGFCSDIVYQGVGALRPLASGLEHADHWYFWWD